MSEKAFADWKRVGQLLVPAEPVAVAESVDPELPGALEAGAAFSLLSLEWSWGFGTSSSIAIGCVDVSGTRYYLASDGSGHRLIAAALTLSESADRELLDLFFDLTWEEWGLQVINAPTDVWWAQPFTLDDVATWLARAYQRHPDLWDETLNEALGHLDDDDDASAQLPPRPRAPALDGEAELRRKLEEEEPEPGYSSLRGWALQTRRDRIEASIEAWRREQDPAYAAACEKWTSEVARIERERAETRGSDLMRRYLTEYVGLSE